MSETEVTTEVNDDLDAFASDFFGEKSVPEAKQEPVEAVQEEQKDSVEPEAQPQEEVDPNEDLEAEFKEAPPKKKTVQDRIDEVVRQREDQRREFEAKIAALEAKFAEKETPKPVVQGEPTPDDLNEDGTPKYGLGEFDPQYVRDLTKFAFAQERERMATEQEQNAAQAREIEARNALTVGWNEKVEAAKISYPDFQDKATGLLDSFNYVEPQYAQYLSGVLMSMDHGTDVLYYLSNNPEEATKIVNSGAQKATLALGRIEAKFYEAEQQKQAAKPKVSKAPPPPQVQARGTNGAFISVAPDTDDLDAFQAEFFKSAKAR